MHVSKDSMWQEIWKILQNFLGTKQGLGSKAAAKETFLYHSYAWILQTKGLYSTHSYGLLVPEFFRWKYSIPKEALMVEGQPISAAPPTRQ
jgi:hypothetical protein